VKFTHMIYNIDFPKMRQSPIRQQHCQSSQMNKPAVLSSNIKLKNT